MTEFERRHAVVEGIERFGWDFFMVDLRQKAAPFHIEEERDAKLFVDHGSHLVNWIPSENTLAMKEALDRKYDLLRRKIVNYESSSPRVTHPVFL